MAIVIEPAAQSDVSELVGLLHALFAQEQEFAPDAERQRRGLEMILSSPKTGRIFVAREKGETVGMINLLFTVSTALGAPVCWLEDMVVRPDKRGAGIGSRLVTHAIGFARAHGYVRITLMTDAGNADARRFYERHGFARSEMVAMRVQLS
jgi:GNAT superfamily N-acetyltransferase